MADTTKLRAFIFSLRNSTFLRVLQKITAWAIVRVCKGEKKKNIFVIIGPNPKFYLYLVEINEGVELPVLLVDGDVELLDTLEGELVALDEDADGVTHELLGDLEDLSGHGGGEQDDLDSLGKEPEDLVDLVLEPPGEHLVSLVEDKHLDVVGLEGAAVDHVKHTAGRANDDVDTD